LNKTALHKTKTNETPKKERKKKAKPKQSLLQTICTRFCSLFLVFLQRLFFEFILFYNDAVQKKNAQNVYILYLKRKKKTLWTFATTT
jgi:hypothetical protein